MLAVLHHPLLRAGFRRLGIVHAPIFLLLFTLMLYRGRGLEDPWTFWIVFTNLIFTLGFAVDAIVVWRLLHRKHSSFGNKVILVFKEGVSWGFLAQLEKNVTDQIGLVTKHCPELAASALWKGAIERGDFVALSVTATEALKKKERAITQTKRREVAAKEAEESLVADLQKAGASGGEIAACQNIDQLLGLQRRLTVKKHAEELGMLATVAESLERGDTLDAERLFAAAKQLLADGARCGIEHEVRTHLSQNDLPAAQKMIVRAKESQLHERTVARLMEQSAKLPAALQTEVGALIEHLADHPFASREYKKALYAVEKRIGN